MPARESLIGRTFGKLKVIAEAPDYIYKGGTNRMSLCLCECGVTKAVCNGALKRGTKSCGCLIGETATTLNSTHRMSKTRIYNVWVQMKARCNRPQHPNFKYYGGRGITICKRWQTFENFLEDVGHGKKGWTIERVDVNGNYEMANICWATMIQQARNKRNNAVFTVQGITGCLSELCERFGQDYGNVSQRIRKLGWPPEKALTEPNHRK